MDQAGDGKTAPQAAAPEHLRWDTSDMQSHRCTVATASATFDEVVLNFGAKSGHDYPGGEVAAELLQRITLRPLAAKHLLATLQKLLADLDNRPRPSR